jgi:hypothetical protein
MPNNQAREPARAAALFHLGRERLFHVLLEAAQQERLKRRVQLLDLGGVVKCVYIVQVLPPPQPPSSVGVGVYQTRQAVRTTSGEKSRGARKASNDHSSRIVFCSGVPVTKSRCSDRYSCPAVSINRCGCAVRVHRAPAPAGARAAVTRRF